MKLTYMIAAAAIGLSITSADAADLYGSKDPIFTPANVNWTGAYVQCGGGLGFAQTHITPLATDLSSTGGSLDCRVGYDFATPGIRSGLLIGLLAGGGNAFDVNGKVFNLTLGQQWGYYIGGRVGYDYGTGLIYIPLAYAHQDVTFSGPTTGLNGVKFGLGFEEKIAANWALQLEVTQTRFDSASLNTFFGTIPSKAVNDAAMLSLVYKFH